MLLPQALPAACSFVIPGLRAGAIHNTWRSKKMITGFGNNKT
jgi:hypothetical protein